MDTLRVLVTDDEMGMRLGVERTLRDFTVQIPDVNEEVNFVVEQAGSGEEALEKIRTLPPDILLLDHKMPGMSGLDVLDQLVGMPADMLTIMITAYASIETAVAATKRGAYDFLAKPFTPAELKSTIRKAAARLVLAKEARKLAEEKRQVRFEFIRVLAHELKSPLNAIAGYMDLIKSRQLGADVTEYDEIIDRTLVRIDGMHKLIHDLLDLTQIESGRKSRRLVALDVRAVVQSAIEALQAEACQHNITIALEAGDALPIMADARELEMVANNLLSNAVKYNRDGGRVTVTLARADSKVTISVADTGIGMTPDALSQLFHEFVRIKSEKTRHILGSGLGLSIVKKIAQLYEGEVKVLSEPDQGSTFTVTLQAALPPA